MRYLTLARYNEVLSGRALISVTGFDGLPTNSDKSESGLEQHRA